MSDLVTVRIMGCNPASRAALLNATHRSRQVPCPDARNTSSTGRTNWAPGRLSAGSSTYLMSSFAMSSKIAFAFSSAGRLSGPGSSRRFLDGIM
ncbi:hypothetical protein [Arachnia propionica]|uniref:hypothetical protein n=1 Tax=Arachnia propionica TaxID=1750 RepID=UPI00167AA471|nr:hypothetical protein [Arachnia propionica]